jgi:hypothetical protein
MGTAIHKIINDIIHFVLLGLCTDRSGPLALLYLRAEELFDRPLQNASNPRHLIRVEDIFPIDPHGNDGLRDSRSPS